MIFTGVSCDSCDKHLIFSIQGDPKKHKLPESWFTLYKGDYMENDPWHFCCWLCLGNWLMKEKPTENMDAEAKMAAKDEHKKEHPPTTKEILFTARSWDN